MKRKTNFTSKEKYREELRQIVSSLYQIYSETQSALVQKSYSVTKGGYHMIGNMLKPPYESNLQKIVYSMMLRQILKAEKLSARSGEIVFLSVITFIDEIIKNEFDKVPEYELQKHLEATLEKIKYAISDASRSMTEKELRHLVRTKCEGHPYLAEACLEAISLAGLEGKIYVESGNQDCFFVELKEGYVFKVKPYDFFTDKKQWNMYQCKALVVDGFVESVSEIDHILNIAHETKQPMIIISHGYSEEVVSTLYTNFKKDLLNIIPLRLESDVESVNVINDIGVVCGMDPISSLKGQMLTFVKYDDIPTIEKITITKDQITIENSSTVDEVLKQIRGLLKKRENVDPAAIEELQMFLDKRIKSLTPNQVIINLPKTNSYEDASMKVVIDELLREIKFDISQGVCTPNHYLNAIEYDIFGCHTPNLIENIYDEVFFKASEDAINATKRQYPDFFPSTGLYIGFAIGAKTAISIICSSGMVTPEES